MRSSALGESGKNVVRPNTYARAFAASRRGPSLTGALVKCGAQSGTAVRAEGGPPRIRQAGHRQELADGGWSLLCGARRGGTTGGLGRNLARGRCARCLFWYRNRRARFEVIEPPRLIWLASVGNPGNAPIVLDLS
jgi:hypothetical protein